ncbi:MAG: hypothetical protein GXO83_11545 [Chlorobi bacterium]|nr:hypothetical protein [Chlorobiota bacterium]
MRKQYHFRPSANGYYAWDIDRLVSLASACKPQKVKLGDIAEIDEPFWFDRPDDIPTCRQIAVHARLIEHADLGYPVIMSPDHRIMDGMHRVLKALNTGLKTIDAVIFENTPEPDYIDVQPDELLY